MANFADCCALAESLAVGATFQPGDTARDASAAVATEATILAPSVVTARILVSREQVSAPGRAA